MFETYSGVVAVDALGVPPVAYVCRQVVNQIALWDTLTIAAGEASIYRCHVATGESNKRDKRKRSKRILVYGTGLIQTGLIIIVADNTRSESYPVRLVNLGGQYAHQQILIMQGTQGIAGVTFDVALELYGIGVIVNDVQIEWTEIE